MSLSAVEFGKPETNEGKNGEAASCRLVFRFGGWLIVIPSLLFRNIRKSAAAATMQLIARLLMLAGLWSASAMDECVLAWDTWGRIIFYACLKFLQVPKYI